MKERFVRLKRTDFSDDEILWFWRHTVWDGNGEGNKQFHMKDLGGHRHNYVAARIAYALVTGWCDPTQLICHTCDNPRCVTPWHWFVGDDWDNQNDAARKGRKERGRDRASNVLHEWEVREIRDSDLTLTEAAKLFDVSISTIRKIRRREMWAWLE
jgi:hypothetical protein